MKKILFLCLISLMFSCKLYKQNYMFRVNENMEYDSIKSVVSQIDLNYKIKIGDYLSVKVYTSNGESLIDPENQLSNSGASSKSISTISGPKYLVNPDGSVSLPMVGKVNLDSLTLIQADSVLQTEYNKFYLNSFVKTSCENRRVIVLGGIGGKVIPLENENMNLIEVLALAGGIDDMAKASNIRLIRGDLNNPQVEVIDLTTIDGMRKANLRVQSNDIIYVEPVKKVLREALRDITPILSLITSTLTFVFVLSSNRK